MFRVSVLSAQHRRSRWRRLLPGGRGLVPSDVHQATAVEVGRVLRFHRRAWWWPTRCRCGTSFPCGARLTALDDQLRAAARQACDWYPRYFADRRQAEGRQR